MIKVRGLHARGCLALYIDFFHPALVEKVIHIGAAQRRRQGAVDIAGTQAQGSGLAIVNADLELRCIVQAVAANPQQAWIFSGQLKKLFTGRHQRIMAQATEVLELQVEPRALAQTANSRRLHDERIGITDAGQCHGRPLGNGRPALAGASALGPVLEANKRPRGVLAVPPHAQPADADHRVDFGLFQDVVLELLDHGLRAAVRGPYRQLDLCQEDPLVFVRQERSGQAHVARRHDRQHQPIEQQAAPPTLQHHTHPALVSGTGALKGAVEPAEEPVLSGMPLTVAGFEQRCAERGCQGHRHQHRQHHGRNNGHRKLPIDNPGGAPEKRHGNKHRAQHQSDADQGAADFTHRLARGCHGR